MNLVKKITAVLMVLSIVLCFAACSSSEEENSLDIGTINMGLILPGDAEKDAYSKNQHESFKRAYSLCGAGDGQVTLEQNISSGDTSSMEKAMTDLVERGCRLIVGIDPGYCEELASYAKKSIEEKEETPVAYFACLGNSTTTVKGTENFTVLKVNSKETEYIQGVTAALSTESGKVAYIADKTYGTVDNADVNAFAAGVKNAKSDVEVFFISTDDVKAGIDKAVKAGCDVLYSRNYVVDAEKNQLFFNVPDSVASAMTLNKVTADGTEFISGTSYNYDVLYTKVVLCTVNKQFTDLTKYTWGIKDGIVDIFPAKDTAIKEKVEAIKDSFIKGEDVIGELSADLAGVTNL